MIDAIVMLVLMTAPYLVRANRRKSNSIPVHRDCISVLPHHDLAAWRRTTPFTAGCTAVESADLLEEPGEDAPASPARTRRYRWAAFHDAVTKVLCRYGTVGSGEGVVFYLSGDWFDERVDAFSLMSGAGVSAQCLGELQNALIRHDPAATLILEADTDSPLWGLEIYVRARTIDIGWYESDAATCSRMLRECGLDFGAE